MHTYDPSIGRLKQENHEFEASMGYKVRRKQEGRGGVGRRGKGRRREEEGDERRGEERGWKDRGVEGRGGEEKRGEEGEKRRLLEALPGDL
jgi:hypothetical protein